MSTKIDIPYLRKMGAIIKLQGKEYTTHQGLLYVAHQQGIISITTEMISWDPDRRQAVFKSTAIGERGTFTGWGDADPTNVGKMIANACIRMAETRSISRSLRLYLGIGMTAYDELPGREQEEPAPPRTDMELEQERREFAEKQEEPQKWSDKERKTFMARIAHDDINYGYPVVKKMCEMEEWPAPSLMDQTGRDWLIKFCLKEEGQDKLADAHAVIDYHRSNP